MSKSCNKADCPKSGQKVPNLGCFLLYFLSTSPDFGQMSEIRTFWQPDYFEPFKIQTSRIEIPTVPNFLSPIFEIF